jgi:hypothetical protein
MIYRPISALLLSLLVVGCSDHKAASEKNFKTALQAYHDHGYPICYLKHKFPYETKKTSGIFGGLSSDDAYFDAFAKIGLLTKDEKTKETKIWGQPQYTTTYTYNLSETGKKFYTEKIDGNDRFGFCFGKAKVETIKQFTEPVDFIDGKMTRVNYTYSVSDIPEWVKSLDNNRKIFPSLELVYHSKTSPIARTENLILTNNGWVHHRMFSK